MKNWIRLSRKESLDYFWKQTSLKSKSISLYNDWLFYYGEDYVKYKTKSKYWDGILYIGWYSWRIYYNPFKNALRLYIPPGKIIYKSYKILKIPNPIILYNKELTIEKIKIGYDIIEPNKIFKYE